MEEGSRREKDTTMSQTTLDNRLGDRGAMCELPVGVAVVHPQSPVMT